MTQVFARNAGGLPFLIIEGAFVIRKGQQPDGDTIHFAAARKYSKGPVACDVPVSRDGSRSVAVRYQSIDAPEKTQPWGAAWRDAALKHLRIHPAEAGLGDEDFTADGPTVSVPGWLATDGMDNHGRQLGYLFRADPGLEHGALVSAEELEPLLKSSTNYYLVANGWAYPSFYENTDEGHATHFQKAARKARDQGRGVWELDETATGFLPTPWGVGKEGALIYPKFFRRVAGWKTAKESSSAFIGWLKKQEDGKKYVEGAEPKPVQLWELFEPIGAKRVCVPYDVTRLWFRER